VASDGTSVSALTRPRPALAETDEARRRLNVERLWNWRLFRAWRPPPGRRPSGGDPRRDLMT
jgi:hypothetical protein